nr:MAG TPA: 43 kDa tail protein [Caudoviricetes sp.]
MSDISLILYRDGKTYDISELVESIKWKGRKGSAARSVSISLLDCKGAQSGIDVTKGHQLIFSYKGKELFRGMIMSQQQSESFKMPITAYDNGIYLSNNKDTFVYENKTVHDIFIDVCKRFGIKYSDVAKTSYKIPELTKSKTTAWDAILDAISQDFKATGTKYYVNSSKGVLSLIKRRENILQWVLETGGNIMSYTYKKSIEDIKTRLKILSDEDKVYAVKKNTELEKKIGIFQDIEKKDDDLSEAKLQEHIKETLKEISTPEISLSVEALGIPDVISGVGVYVIIDELGIKRTFYVDEDTHTFKGGSHTMNLTLNSVNE